MPPSSKIQLPQISAEGFLLFFDIVYHCHFSDEVDDIEKTINTLLEKKETLQQWGNSALERSREIKEIDKSLAFYSKIYSFKDKDINNNSKPIIKWKQDISIWFSLIKDKYPNEPILSSINVFVNNIERYVSIKDGETDDNSTDVQFDDNRININPDLLNTTWYFYYHEYEPTFKKRTPYSVISRLLLHIGTEGITLYERDQNDFEVTSAEFVDPVQIINFERKSLHSRKKLEIRIILKGNISSKSVLLGQYMDFESRNEIVSGTFILENVRGHQDNISADATNFVPNNNYKKLIPKKSNNTELAIQIANITYYVIQRELVYYTNWEEYIPSEIAKYLSNKWKNFTKTSPRVSSIQTLGTFLNDQKDKPFKESKFNTFIDYDVFIASPVGHLSETQNSKFLQQVNNTFFEYPVLNKDATNEMLYGSKKTLKDIGIHKIYYPPRVYIHEQHEHAIENDMNALRNSRFVFLIMPDAVCTSALIKIGWALEIEKPIYLFPLKLGVLPELLTKNCPHFIKIPIEEIKLTEIPKALIKYKKDFKII